MKKYINPSTTILSVATQTIICASEPQSTGGNPSDARTPGRRAGGLYI